MIPLQSIKKERTTLPDSLSRIKKERLSDEEADQLLKCVPLIPGDETIVKIFEEEECD